MPGAANQEFSRNYRLRSPAQFAAVYDRRCSASDGVLIVYGRPNELAHARIGLSVSRAVGGAVERNRWKRLLREAFRTSKNQLPAGVDLVIVPRKGIVPVLAEVRPSLVKLAGRVAGRLESDGK